MIVMQFFVLLVMELEGMAVPAVEAQELIPPLFNLYFEKRVLSHCIRIASSNQLALVIRRIVFVPANHNRLLPS